jgi:hypothetical protein
MWTWILQIRHDPAQISKLLVEMYQRPLQNFAVYEGLSYEDAQEVVQEP